MKELAAIIVGVLILRTFDVTWDIVGFWQVLGYIVAWAIGIILVIGGIVETVLNVRRLCAH